MSDPQLSSDESALVVFVREAEILEPFRDRHDPSAAAGVPAHITLLYPFKTPHEIDAALICELQQHFSSFSSFQFSLTMTQRFLSPGAVLYLAPAPAEPFRQLTLSIWKRYPDSPPYGGKYADIVPHMCLAQVSSIKELDKVADEFNRGFQANLPIHVTASEVALMDKVAGRWNVRTTFDLRAN